MYIFICKKNKQKPGRGEEKSPRGPCDRPVLEQPPHPVNPPHSMTSPGATVTSCKGIS